jgi:hypothetical protein
MTSTTSQVHPETVSGWSPIEPLVSGMGSSLAFTIPTGLAGQQTNGLPLPAFRTCYGPHHLSVKSKSRDLQHLSPVLAHCGNTALRDMAHMFISPINAGIPHRYTPSQQNRSEVCKALYRVLAAQRSISAHSQDSNQGRTV